MSFDHVKQIHDLASTPAPVAVMVERSRHWSAAMGPDRNMALGFVPPRSRVRDRVRTEYIDLRDRRDAGIGYNLLNRPQSCFDAFHLSAMLRRAFSALLGNQSTHFLFVLKPPPEPDPNH